MNRKITLLIGALAIVSSSFAQISFNINDQNAWSVNTEFEYNLTSYLTNDSEVEADTAFEWYIRGVDMPSTWEVQVCSGLLCIPNPNPDTTYKFNIPLGGREAFKLGFFFFETVGDGSARVIARSVMDNSVIDSFHLEMRAGTLSISSASDLESIKVYPNPAKDVVTVDFRESGMRKVSLYDVLGNLQKEELISSGSTINVSDLTKGVYILRLEGDDAFSKVIQKL